MTTTITITAGTSATARTGTGPLPVRAVRALGDPLRWQIVALLAAEQVCVSHLAERLGVTQPLVSHHLKALRDAGLLVVERYRYWTYYRVASSALLELAGTLAALAAVEGSPVACPHLPADTTAARPRRARSASMPTQPSESGLDPVSRDTFARTIAQLVTEFEGIFSRGTVERYVDESVGRMSGARVVDFLPLFVHRFTRERLRALAQVEGRLTKDVPEVLFVCTHNAGRSQIAAALLDHHARGRVHVRSAGSDPADKINPAVVAALDEWDIDLSREFPKPLTDEVVKAADAVVTMGCGDACPIYPGKRYEDWQLEDPDGKPVEVARRIRDDIDRRVQQLLTELLAADTHNGADTPSGS